MILNNLNIHVSFAKFKTKIKNFLKIFCVCNEIFEISSSIFNYMSMNIQLMYEYVCMYMCVYAHICVCGDGECVYLCPPLI